MRSWQVADARGRRVRLVVDACPMLLDLVPDARFHARYVRVLCVFCARAVFVRGTFANLAI